MNFGENTIWPTMTCRRFLRKNVYERQKGREEKVGKCVNCDRVLKESKKKGLSRQCLKLQHSSKNFS